MSDPLTVAVPDIGDFSGVPVIEVLVAPGDRVDVETPLVTLESDKATMDVPSPHAGTVESVLVAVGDTVSEGVALLVLAAESDAAAPGVPDADTGAPGTRSRSDTPEPPGDSGTDGARSPPAGPPCRGARRPVRSS